MQLIYDLSQIDSIASKVIAHSTSNVLLFYGDMGVGKTTLIKAIVKQLGIQEVASSPTFSIVNEYINDKGECIYHFDFYRIKNEDEALDLGFEEYIDQGDWICIEWPEKISKHLPQKVQNIVIKELELGKRLLNLE